jgi:putative phosphoribosyl transferase
MLAIKEEITIPAGGVSLEGELIIPEGAQGIVIFSHGSGSSRHSPRNRFVAGRLHQKKVATLLFDLLTEEEDEFKQNRFDIELLTKRLEKATHWVSQQNETHRLPIGYFGASTGAASALKAAARRGDKIKAVVARGGRPDLAVDEIAAVTAATLFIVGGEDYYVIQQNEQAYAQLQVAKSLEIISGASHLFEESGTLEQAADFAASWYTKHLCQEPV